MPGAPVKLAQAGRSSLLTHSAQGGARFDVLVTVDPDHPGRLTFSTTARALVVAGDNRPLYIRLDGVLAKAASARK
jgi:hypothetical protein